MTAITAEGHRAAPGPCLIAAPSAGPAIGALFALTVVLFLAGLLALAPGL